MENIAEQLKLSAALFGLPMVAAIGVLIYALSYKPAKSEDDKKTA
jgi:hypothetical protein